jgi:hypothetical protein
LAVLCATLTLALAGCSVATSSSGLYGASEAGAIAVGAKAAGTATTGSSSGSASQGTSGWVSTIACPDTFRQGLLSTAPAGTTATALDPTKVDGVESDPELFVGDIPNCAYLVTISGRTVDAIAFVGMPASYQSAIIAKLQADGFVGAAPTAASGGQLQIFSSTTSRVAVETLTYDGQSFFGLTG